MNPRSWKAQLIRAAASFHGGLDLYNSLFYVGGDLYYIGEATRIISAYEPLFWDGERADELAVSDQIKYPNLLVLRKGAERLVLLFNEDRQPLSVKLRNKGLRAGQTAVIYGTALKAKKPAVMDMVVAPEDVAVVYIK